MILFWTYRARADRSTIYAHVERDDPKAAIALDERFERSVERLLVHPDSGRPGRVGGTRELVAHPSYIVIYDVVGDYHPDPAGTPCRPAVAALRPVTLTAPPP